MSRYVFTAALVLITWSVVLFLAWRWDVHHPPDYVRVTLQSVVSPRAPANSWSGRHVTVSGTVWSFDEHLLLMMPLEGRPDVDQSVRLFIPPPVRVPASGETAIFSGTLRSSTGGTSVYELQVEPPGFVRSTLLRRVFHLSAYVAFGAAVVIALIPLRRRLRTTLSSWPRATRAIERLTRVGVATLLVVLAIIMAGSVALMVLSHERGWVWDHKTTDENGFRTELAVLSGRNSAGWISQKRPPSRSPWRGAWIQWTPGSSSSLDRSQLPSQLFDPFRISHESTCDVRETEDEYRLLGLFVRSTTATLSTGKGTFDTVLIPYFMVWVVAGAFAVPLVRTWRRMRRRTPDGTCRCCGYDLRASTDRCPECGTTIPLAIEA